MSVGNIIKLALALVRLVNWLTSRVDRREWEKSGYRKAMNEQLKEMMKNIGIADAAVKEADSATPEKRREILESDI